MEERTQKRDLVLAPSEYAYMQDVTKGVVKTYTGPTVINPTAQERPVRFDAGKKCFEPCSLEDGVQRSAIAPEGYYLVLKNPSARGDHPAAGGVHPSPDLMVGRKININGPCDFALWPGQIVKLVQGHHLRSNQYLLVRVYNEDEARRNWGKAVIKPAAVDAGATSASDAPRTEGAAAPSGLTRAPGDLTVGKLYIIRGTEVSFYIPPTGVGVVAEEAGLYVRDALTLERLEFCILVDENGKKRYERGPQVVFPEPTETFIVRDGQRKFRALELNEIQGLHIKVIAPYEESGRRYREGDEIFLTGKETAIYFPREEHSLVRYDGRDKHFAVAVPAGEGRYVMKRKTGDIAMVRGPAMLLPNPVDEVVVRRVLTDRECATWYPGNDEALGYNKSLRALAQHTPTTRSGVVSEGDVERSRGRGAKMAKAVVMESSGVSVDAVTVMGDVLERGSNFTQPRTLVFNTKYEGVPTIEVHTGYAVQVVDKQGTRRVEVGPRTLLLEYDETLELLGLSTGRPKAADKLVETAYVKIANDHVTDRCEVETADHVRVRLDYGVWIAFDGDPSRWFAVDNYVQLACDRVRAALKTAVVRLGIDALTARAADLIRAAVVGDADAGTGQRLGMAFPENGMRVVDVELDALAVLDDRIARLVAEVHQEAVEAGIGIARAERALSATKRQEELAREEAETKTETTRRKHELEAREVESRLALALATVAAEIRQHQEQRAAAEAKNQALEVDHQAALARQESGSKVRQGIARGDQAIALETLRVEAETAVRRFEAAQSGFAEALLALSNHDVLVKVAEAMSVQSFVGGKTLTDVLDKVFAGTPLEGVMEKVKGKANGGKDAPSKVLSR